LAKLDHPNIAIVHEFGSGNEVDFLVIEYIPGVTLDVKLAAGPLPEAEIVRLGRQLSEGLEAAHEKGVIHRDLKPANLRLTPSGRLKILDFGIAHLVQPERDTALTASLTQSKEVIGTLPYMAPEQLRGQRTDARSDIWAAGAVLYEMAAGRRPFLEPTAPLLVDAILNKPPQPPTALNQQISSGLQGVILKALEKNPERRYQSAHELGADLEKLGTGAVPAVVLQRRWAWVGAVAALIVLIAGGFFLWHFARPRGKPTASAGASVRARRSVAVLGFKNLSGRADVQWLSTALSEMLTTELAAGEELRTVSGEAVAQMKIDLSIPDANTYSPTTLARIRKILNANYVVLGSYLDLGQAAGGGVRLDLRLQDAEAGETVTLLSVKGTETQLDDLVTRAGTDLRKKLGVQEVAASEAETVRAGLPSSPEALRLYSEGLAKLRVFDAQAAGKLLEGAIAIEPNCALAHSAYAAVWTSLGYDEKAKQEAKRASELTANLSREERLSVEARYRETTNDWDKAIEIYRTLFNFFPDNLDYGLQLARAQSSAGKGKDTLATIELLRKFAPPQGDDPRLDLAEADAGRSLGDFRRVEASAGRAAVKGQDQGSQLVVAQARNGQCLALRNLGEPKKAIPACEEARRIYAATGDRSGVAMVLNNLANNLYDQGDLAGAKKLYEETLATYRQIGNKRGAAGALDNLSNLAGDLGDPTGARKLSEEALKMYREVSDYTGVGETLNNIAAEQLILGDFEGASGTFQQALDIWRRTGDRNGVATTLNNMADMLLGRGDLAQARSRYQEALSTFQETGQRSKSAYPLSGLAEVLSAQGELASAKLKYEQALAICREANDKHQSASALFGLGAVLAYQGDLAAARQRHEEALAIRKAIGEKASAAESLLALAGLALEEGRPVDAETSARKAVDEFRAEKLRDDEIMARATLARALLLQHKDVEAGREIGFAADLAGGSPSREVHMRYAISAAKVRAATGGVAEAAKILEATLAEAMKYGYFGCQLEARLGLGEIEIKSGQATAGRARLEALEEDAKARGFLLIARKAAKARG
jgi:tetratricopeptide (TPR) repeat protein